jgi:hypothetical protein
MRRRIAALVVAFATLGTVGATAAKAATPSTASRPWACIGEKDIHTSVCLYTPVPDPQTSGQ